MEWRRDFVRTYLERDVPQFGSRIPAETLRRFWTMLAHNQSQMLNASSLAGGLGVDGKTVAESFSSPAAWRKAQAEIEEYHRFQRLIAELIAINEKICLQRPRESPDGAWTPEEKKRLLRSLTRSLAK